MNPVNINNPVETINDGPDSIVIQKHLAGVPGGETLDTTSFAPEYVYAGHPIIRETATKTYKPWPVTGTAPNYTLDALPTGHTYEGITVSTARKTQPHVGIMTAGQVNVKAMRYQPGSSALTSMQANQHIYHIND